MFFVRLEYSPVLPLNYVIVFIRENYHQLPAEKPASINRVEDDEAMAALSVTQLADSVLKTIN